MVTVREHKGTLHEVMAYYVEPTQSHPGSAFKLTAKGAEFLGLRGAGLSEA